MKEEIENPYPENNCFFCGSENTHGLHLKFHWDKEKKEVSTEYLPAEHFVGQGNILHGGIQMGLLDEIMGWTSYVVSQQMGVTSELKFKFLQPLYIGEEEIKVTCRVSSQEGPKVNMQATLSDSDGAVCTTATGTYHMLAPDRYKKIITGDANKATGALKGL